MNKLRKMRQTIQRLFDRLVIWMLGEKCEKCGSRKLKHSHLWTRGWNNLCEEACGDSGTRCNDCGYIKWDSSLEEYKEILPEWCDPYANR